MTDKTRNDVAHALEAIDRHYEEQSRLKRQRLIRSLQTAPLRCCYTVHECALCDKDIKAGQYYADRGYGRRAHADCVDILSGALEQDA